ncbi:MAG: LysR family transcriptional regulator [Elusimicrobia bacterium]|nr:LysR family transcriptional regulator [Elusimicrobiota bacterium]
MDLYQLRYFLEVARELNFTRAAENLHISPPAVSRSVQLLERSIGKKLFARTKRRVALTSDGEFLKARAERVFDEVERARLELSGQRVTGPSMLRIGTREMITHYLLPRPLLEFKNKWPSVRFGLYELDPRALADALKKDQIDFGLYYCEIPDPALEAKHLGSMRSHIYASKKLLPNGKAPKSLEQILSLPFIAPRYFHSDPSTPSPDGFPDHRYARNVQYEGEFLETHRRFVLDGLAVAVLPDLVIEEEWKRGLVTRLEEGPRISREVYLFKRRSRPLPQAVEAFAASLRKAIKDATG